MTDEQRLVLHHLRHLTTRLEALHTKVDKLRRSNVNSKSALKRQLRELRDRKASQQAVANLAKQVANYLDLPQPNPQHDKLSKREFGFSKNNPR
jgi:GTP-binding protein EngB required for normal cell division